MRMTLRFITPVIAAAGAAAAIAAAPAAVADTTLPTCTGVGGDEVTGGATECATPGNVQLNATPPEPDYPYPWDDEFYGPALIIGGFGGGGGGHGGGGR